VTDRDFNPRAMMEKAIDLMLQSVNEPRQDGKASPKVGAVLIVPYELAVGRNRLITGFRGELRLGDHAEFTLLERKCRDWKLDGSVLFTTLEPCAPGARNHPKLPCAERIVLARMKEVWVGLEDPDPTVYRKGIKYLEDNSIAVHMFDPDLQVKIREENEVFIGQALERAAAAQKEKKPHADKGGRRARVLGTPQDAIARLKAAGKAESTEEYQGGFDAGRAWAQNTASPGQLRRLYAYTANFDSHFDWWDVDYVGWLAPYGATDYFVFAVSPECRYDRGAPTEFWELALGDESHRVADADFFHGFGDGAVAMWSEVEGQM
jgi:pyrimidine deaminase RibD-like protein